MPPKPQLKPGMWAVTPAAVDPLYQSFWRDLMLCLPLWEGSGAPTEIVTKLTADSISALDWITTEYGPAVNSDSAARITWTSFPTGSFGESQGTTDPEVSIVFLVRVRASGNSHAPLAWSSNSPTGEPDGLWSVGVNTTAVDDWQIAWDDAGIHNTELSTVAVAGDTIWELVTITREKGGVFRFYHDGIEVASSTDTTAWNAVATDLQLVLFKEDANATRTFGSVAFAAAWNRVLSAAEIGLLSDNIYGFITPAVIEVEAGAGPQTLDGVLFSRPPAFIAGTVTPTNVIDGVVFSRPPVFIAGVVTTTNLISGVLFTRPPAFIVGIVTPGGVQLDGVLFARPPTFIPGSVSQRLTGVLFARPPSFIAGIVTTTNVIDGVLFVRSPTFLVGVISLPEGGAILTMFGGLL